MILRIPLIEMALKKTEDIVLHAVKNFAFALKEVQDQGDILCQIILEIVDENIRLQERSGK